MTNSETTGPGARGAPPPAPVAPGPPAPGFLDNDAQAAPLNVGSLLSSLFSWPAFSATWNAQRFARLRRELAWIFAGSLLTFPAALLSIKAFTKLLGSRGYGVLALGLTVSAFLGSFLYGPLLNVVTRFFPIHREKATLPIYFGALRRAYSIAVAISLPLGALAAIWIGRAYGTEWGWVVFLSVTYCVVAGVNGSMLALFSVVRRRKIVALLGAADAWLRVTLGLVFVLFLARSPVMVLAGMVCGTLLVVMAQSVLLRRFSDFTAAYERSKVDPGALARAGREMFAFGATFVLWSGLGVLSTNGDRWVTEYLIGTSALGIYTAVFQVANAPVAIIYGLLTQFMVPIALQRAGSSETREQMRRATKLVYQFMLVLALVTAAGGVVLVLFSRPILLLLTSPAIAEAHRLLGILFASMVAFQLGQLAAQVGTIHCRPMRYWYCYFVNAAATVGFSLFLGKRLGIYGIAMAMLLSNVAYLISVLYTNRTMRSASAGVAAPPQEFGREGS